MSEAPMKAVSFFLLIWSGLFVLMPDAHAATTFTVTTTADNVIDDGSCTLREAISAANGSPANTNCGSGTGPYTINFSISGTITLGSALPNIASDLSIDASGHSVTVSGNNSVKIFHINSGATVHLTSLAIVNGNYFGGWGGGIANSGTLTVTNCTVTGNSAWFGGGIYDDYGTLTVTNSTITGNSASGGGGGGIFTGYGALTVTNSTISGNSSYSGGGIFNDQGTLTVDNSTVSANTATNVGGGVANNAGQLSVTNSTISGNSAPTGGGIYIGSGSTALANSTLADNSTIGIYTYNGALNVMNCIIAKRSASGYCCYGGHTAANNNLADDNTCGSGFTESASILLGSLGTYGGSTQTIPLLPGSAALDAGDDEICTDPPVNNLDQRGVRRPMGMHCDIGAFEYRGQVKLLPAGAIFDSIQDAYNSAMPGSIIIEAQTYVIPDELVFDYDSNVTLKGGMDGSYNQTSGYTPVNKLSVEKGQAVISNIIIKP